MHLVELIACTESDAAMLDDLETFLVTTSARAWSAQRTRPISSPIASAYFPCSRPCITPSEFGLGFDVVDALTGPLIGRPKSATFRTADVVGLDTLAHVVKTMRDTLPHDPWHKYFVVPGWLQGIDRRRRARAENQARSLQEDRRGDPCARSCPKTPIAVRGEA